MRPLLGEEGQDGEKLVENSTEDLLMGAKAGFQPWAGGGSLRTLKG